MNLVNLATIMELLKLTDSSAKVVSAGRTSKRRKEKLVKPGLLGMWIVGLLHHILETKDLLLGDQRSSVRANKKIPRSISRSSKMFDISLDKAAGGIGGLSVWFHKLVFSLIVEVEELDALAFGKFM